MNRLTKNLLLTLGMCALVSLQASAAGKKEKVNPIFDNYFKTPTEAVATPDADGFIRRWNLLEPIGKPNRSNTVFTDSYIREQFAKPYFENQMTIIPEDGQKVKAMVEVQIVDPKAAPTNRFSMEPPKIEQQKATLVWHALDSKLFNVKLFRFADCYYKEHYNAIFWAVTVINCEEDMEVRLAVGSNSASQWWLNGEEVLIHSNDRRMVMDDCVSKRITLKKGKNVLRGAVINGPGMSDFCARFLDEAGNPVRNISVSFK